ncbi:OpgC domain-containing protein [Microbacterium ureisolvens]|uniref:OpgC domain-containing protein n=1 Tax=Microbacterium ureisolvens TaxID=2781186 RepID=A0ABS7I2L3_9MICO|nr:OpgC domain-containing protein [Microbacterium ureisolvens]MBW9110728.1 OpgC domain-containing protein [Microbacterium ureisolvens]
MLDGLRAVALRTATAAAVVAGLLAAPASAAVAGPSPSASAGVPLSPASGAYFGTTIDWSVDTAALEAERLGRTPAVLEHVTPLPLSATERGYLDQFVAQAEEVGALPAVTIAPEEGLADFDETDADEIVEAIAHARVDADVPLYVRFGPGMNAPWVSWGQQPSAYIAAFCVLADAVHTGLPGAAMVWSPTSGAGYPFGAEPAADELDTDADGGVSAGDDPYGPYYPGDRYVDWVGLQAYHDPTGGESAVNAVPQPDALTAQLEGDGDLAFVDRFASPDRPLMLETAAFFSPGAGGAGELELKQAWWRQVIAAVEDVPALDAVVWRDASSTRGVVGRAPIEWSISSSPELVEEFVTDAEAGGLVFGPLYAPSGQRSASAATGATIGGVAGWIVVAAIFAGTIALLVWGFTKGPRSGLAYDGPARRDLRIDLLRGIAIVFVLVNHLGMVSLFQNLSQETIGIVSGAELFVLLSGVVLGMVYRPKIERDGMAETTSLIERRAGKVYVAALGVVIVVGLLSLLPFLNATPATTFVDEGTGAAGGEATGRVYDLYAGFGRLFEYPVDASVFADILLLRMGPWQVNVLGFYVVMLVVSPLILWGLSRGWWIVVLVASWAVYSIQSFLQLRLLPSQFEDSFPLLSWQALFVTGMVAGYHRSAIVGWFTTRWGRAALAVCVLATVGLALFSWNNPYLSSPLDVRLGVVPQNTFSGVYSAWFERTYLDPGRVLNALLVTITIYALFSVLWKPINRAVGWFFIPLGQTTLYVFIMQLVFVLIVANIPFLHEGNLLVNTIAYVVMLGLMWVMVKKRFLFRIIPR